jgi:hypothetical protein
MSATPGKELMIVAKVAYALDDGVNTSKFRLAEVTDLIYGTHAIERWKYRNARRRLAGNYSFP